MIKAIEEIIASPPPSDYLSYLRYKLDAYVGKKSALEVKRP
jgi:hypothetical protein